MRKKVTKTSKLALKKNKKKLKSRCDRLLDLMSGGKEGTAGEFSKIFKIGRNEIAKRLSDLYVKGLCNKLGTKICPVTKNKATIYGHSAWLES